ncbi:MAG: PAS domain S-box protein [Methanomassiliicoccales archaeon]|jgi:hypothetical protein
MTTVLVVDDNPQNIYLLETILRGNGFQVISAENGAKALELAVRSPPDLVISDILMPVMDGFKLCQQWKVHDVLKRIPFIFYTAEYTDPKAEKFASDLGAERFVIKPERPDILIKIVREVLDEAHMKGSVPAAKTTESDVEVLQVYNEVLFRKLENKVKQLETDIAERKAAEMALRESEERFRKVFESGTIGIALYGPDVKVIQINEGFCKMLGYGEKELIGRNMVEITHQDHKEVSIRMIERLRAGEASSDSVEKKYIRKDGSILWAMIKISTILDPNGHLIYFIVFANDITEQKHMEEARKKAIHQIEKNLEQLATLNDEIRNPLAIIVARLALEERTRSTEQMIQAVRAIDGIVNRLDQGWAESAKVREFLERNNQISGRSQNE